MTLVRRRFLHLAGAATAVVAVPRLAWAQPYPVRPVRVIVPFAPGGPTDIAARLIAQKLSEHLGRQFFVENIGGAGGNIGVGHAAKAAPDGHTLLVAAPSYVTNPLLFDKVPYDPHKDFAPVTFAVTSSTVLTVHPSLPAHTIKELIDLVKSNPGKYSYASPGPGTPPHLLGELFRLTFQLDLVHVPFNSGGLAIGSAVAGHTPISFGSVPPAVPHVKEGKLRALAITSKARSPVLPEVPSMPEAGYPDIAADIWAALLVPAGTSTEIVTLLHREIVKIIALPDVRERMAALGYAPGGNSPDECAAQIRIEFAKWERVIREAGIRLQ